jgi:DNA-binding transcriptional ArsR family regulator
MSSADAKPTALIVSSPPPPDTESRSIAAAIIVSSPIPPSTLALPPLRTAIVTRLAEGSTRVTDLAGPTGLRLPTVMRHRSVLEEAGLIATSKDGRVRTCAIVPEALNPMRTWLDEARHLGVPARPAGRICDERDEGTRGMTSNPDPASTTRTIGKALSSHL